MRERGEEGAREGPFLQLAVWLLLIVYVAAQPVRLLACLEDAAAHCCAVEPSPLPRIAMSSPLMVCFQVGSSIHNRTAPLLVNSLPFQGA